MPGLAPIERVVVLGEEDEVVEVDRAVEGCVAEQGIADEDRVGVRGGSQEVSAGGGEDLAGEGVADALAARAGGGGGGDDAVAAPVAIARCGGVETLDDLGADFGERGGLAAGGDVEDQAVAFDIQLASGGAGAEGEGRGAGVVAEGEDAGGDDTAAAGVDGQA